MFKLKPLQLLFGTFFISMILCLFPLYQKVVYELNNRRVELVMSYGEIDEIYLRTGIYRNELIKKFHEAGLTSIIVHEDTIEELINKGKVTYVKGSDIVNNNRIMQRSYNLIFSRVPRQYTIQPEYGYIIIDENNLFDFVKRNLQIKLGTNRVRDLGWNILEIISEEEELLSLPVDVALDKIEFLNELNIPAIVSFRNHEMFSEEQIGYKLSRINDMKIHTVMFDGEEVIGYPKHLDVTVIKLKQLNKQISFIEFTSQAGMAYLSNELSGRIIKTHLLEIPVRSERKALNRVSRAVIGRNNRIIQIQPYMDEESDDIYQFNLNLIKQIKENLEQKGYTIGVIDKNPYEGYRPHVLKYIVYIPVIIIIGVMLSQFFMFTKPIHSLIAVGFYLSLIIPAELFGYQRLLNEVSALLVAISAPVITMIYVEKILNSTHRSKLITTAVQILLLIFVVGVITGVILHLLLSHSNYSWAIWTFRGVKVANFLPFLILLTYFYIKPERLRYTYYVVRRYLSKHLTIKYFVIILAVVVFFTIYLLRTGNYGMLILGSMEIEFRELLQQIFIVRPRTKEILFGYPLLMLLIYVWPNPKVPKEIKQMILVFSSVGVISMINTYCHLHSQFLISAYRSFIGIIIGAVIGVMIINLYHIYNFLLNRILKNKE